jgi:hypothetical protein
MAKPRHILVPTDFSEAADAAKAYAIVLAEAFGATLHVLHVTPDPLAMGWGVDAACLPRLLERTERNGPDPISWTVGYRRDSLRDSAISRGMSASVRPSSLARCWPYSWGRTFPSHARVTRVARWPGRDAGAYRTRRAHLVAGASHRRRIDRGSGAVRIGR